jgi:selenocysteine-specific elongation factor
MRYYVIGTAGHIDHGKSALVKALTGIDPDRLEEEKRRGMTIDLGFAHFDLAGGRRVGIVDVPGHERLIKNMLAGATGIDLVLLVVAADEGVMPQTREHLDILRFLPVRGGIIVLNKVDLVQDPGWIDLVTADLATLTQGTFLEHAPVIQVSARTGEGIPALVGAIDRSLDGLATRTADAPVRLPIDRSFTMAGFGTVVTGTLWSGRIAAGDTLDLLPQRRSVRVRGVQSHGESVEAGLAGSRVAVNLTGIEKGEIERGNVLATPGVFTPTTRLDVRLRLLPSVPPLPHLGRIRLYLGSDEVIGRLALLDRRRLEPGEEALTQIRIERETIANTGDPVVIRRYSPMLTLGGGVVTDPHPPLRRRGETVAQTAATLEERLEAAIQAANKTGVTVEELIARVSASRAQVETALRDLTATGRIVQIRGHVFHVEVRDQIASAIQREVTAFHIAVPWRPGIRKDELKTRAFGPGDNRLYAQIVEQLVTGGEVEDGGGFIRRPGFTPSFSPADVTLRQQLAAALLHEKFAPPARTDLSKSTDPKTFDRVLRTLLDDGTVVEVAPGVYFHKTALEEIRRVVADEVGSKGSVTVASLRDRLQTSRKYALTVLEYLDTIRLTRRVGDTRVLLDRSTSSTPKG